MTCYGIVDLFWLVIRVGREATWYIYPDNWESHKNFIAFCVFIITIIVLVCRKYTHASTHALPTYLNHKSVLIHLWYNSWPIHSEIFREEFEIVFRLRISQLIGIYKKKAFSVAGVNNGPTCWIQYACFYVLVSFWEWHPNPSSLPCKLVWFTFNYQDIRLLLFPPLSPIRKGQSKKKSKQKHFRCKKGVAKCYKDLVEKDVKSNVQLQLFN